VALLNRRLKGFDGRGNFASSPTYAIRVMHSTQCGNVIWNNLKHGTLNPEHQSMRDIKGSST
jgi:hypothetical protein